MYDSVIIGAGTAGMTAALYCARAGRKVLLLESENIGGNIVFSPLVENYPGFNGISGNDLANRLYQQIENLNVDFELDTVTQIRPIEGGYELVCEFDTFQGKTIIAATGVKNRNLGVEGEEEFIGNGISYCALCDGAFYKDKVVAIAGGGDSAFKYAVYLSAICKKVYLIHRRDQFRAEEKNIEAFRNCANGEIITSGIITGFKGSSSLEGVVISKNGEEVILPVDGLFVAVGHVPATDIFKGLVELDPSGFIIAGEDCVTSAKNIFAAGDCRTKTVRQLVTAAADGAVAATAACEAL